MVTDKNLEGKALKEFRNEDFAGKLQVVRLERGIGYHVMKINPAVLMGGVAGARSHSGPAREASKDMGFGYFAMLLAK